MLITAKLKLAALITLTTLIATTGTTTLIHYATAQSPSLETAQAPTPNTTENSLSQATPKPVSPQVPATAPTTSPTTYPAVLTQLQKMPQAERIKFVLNKLIEREAKLQNFEFELDHSIRALDPESHVPLEETQGPHTYFRVRRLGNSNWIAQENDPQENPPTYLSIGSWDGHRSRSFNQVQEYGCGIDSVRPYSLFEYSRYFHILGYEIGGYNFRTLPEWITHNQEILDSGLEIQVANLAGKPLIALSAAGREPNIEPRGHVTYWLDPERDYLTVKWEYHDPYSEIEYNVTDARPVDNLWIPIKLVTLHYSGPKVTSPELATEETYRVTTFKRNHLTAADLQVIFPVDSIVQDHILNVNWLVTPQGFSLCPRQDWNNKGGKMVNSIMPNQAEALKNLGQPNAIILPDTQPPLDIP